MTLTVQVPAWPVVQVQMTGTGTGYVAAASVGEVCDTTCSFSVVLGATITLTARPYGESRFYSWGGSYGAANPLVITVSNNQTLAANFGPIMPTVYLPVVLR